MEQVTPWVACPVHRASTRQLVTVKEEIVLALTWAVLMWAQFYEKACNIVVI